MNEIFLKVQDIDEFDEESFNQLKEYLKGEGYKFDGILIDIKTKTAHIWRHVEPPKPITPIRGIA